MLDAFLAGRSGEVATTSPIFISDQTALPKIYLQCGDIQNFGHS